MKRMLAPALVLLLLSLAACGKTTEAPAAPAAPTPIQTAEIASETAESKDETAAAEAPAEGEPAAAPAEAAYSLDTRIVDVIGDPVFEDYGRLIFPQYFDEPEELGGRIRENWTLKESYNVFFGYKHVNAEVIVDELNAMHDMAESGETIFYDIYTEAEKAEDPMKKETGLFFFRGDPGAKTAIVSPGGAFHYISAAQDGFPQALELSRRGYNAFVPIYRPGARSGCEDVARAVAWLFEHEGELGIDMTDYSLWGGDVGGRLAAWVGRYGTEAFGQEATPKGCVVVQQYTALYGAEITDLPTYANIGKQDTHAYPGNVTLRIASLDALGIDTELEMFETLYHGYNIGRGTEAEGWIDNAIAFWEKHMTN